MTKHEAARGIIQEGECDILSPPCTDCPACNIDMDICNADGKRTRWVEKPAAWFEAWLLANPEPVEEKKEEGK